MQATADDIRNISSLVNDLCGVTLDASKGYLIENRLVPVAEKQQCTSLHELYTKARQPAATALQSAIIDAITTQETLFFRDQTFFDALQYKVLPELIDARNNSPFPRRLRLWSAASSTGQEAYSVAMILSEMLPDIASWDITITATDISDAAIAIASRGVYTAFEIKRGMRQNLLNKYFTKEGNGWKISDRIRSMVTFKKINLLKPFAGLGPFDVVFCRNVAIYFKTDARRDLFNRIARTMARDAYLFVGGSESLNDLGPRFAPQHHCRTSFYRPNIIAATTAA